MRSTRTLLATAAATAVLAIAAPGAYADDTDWGHEDSSYSKEHGKDGQHDKPHGGMHTGGGALTAVTAVNEDGWGTAKDPKHDPETYKDSKYDSGSYKEEEHNKESYSGDHGKPHGGVHTGGGALASPGVTAGGLAVLAVAGAGLFAARRNRVAGNAA
jgi:hypothetical protein